jgi:CHAT domain-containing protein
MYRNYLMLGGAERSLAAWRQGSILPFSEDGILTAEEIGGLDLGRTWLTVLSACQTGAGEAKSGEGILGLRRGFALAGTRYLLFTLWSVDDEDTERFMQLFYEKLFATGDPASAFSETQRAELRRLRQEHDGLTKEALRAGGFVLTR